MFFNYQLKNKNSDDKPRKLNYQTKQKKKKSQQTVQAAHWEGLIALEGANNKLFNCTPPQF